MVKAKAKDFSFLVKAKAKDFYVVLKDTSRPRTNIPDALIFSDSMEISLNCFMPR